MPGDPTLLLSETLQLVVPQICIGGRRDGALIGVAFKRPPEDVEWSPAAWQPSSHGLFGILEGAARI